MVGAFAAVAEGTTVLGFVFAYERVSGFRDLAAVVGFTVAVLFALGLATGLTALVEPAGGRRAPGADRVVLSALGAWLVAWGALAFASLDLFYIGMTFSRMSFAEAVHEVKQLVERVLDEPRVLFGLAAFFAAYAAPFAVAAAARSAERPGGLGAVWSVLGSAILVTPCLAAFSLSNPYLRGKEWGLMVLSLAVLAAFLPKAVDLADRADRRLCALLADRAARN